MLIITTKDCGGNMINYGEDKLGYINYVGSLRYGPTGKKRKNYYKTKSLSTKSPDKTPRESLKADPYQVARQKEREDFIKKYPAAAMYSVGNTSKPDDSYKKETSKKYTVAIGYNKGGYQVIPNSEIKDIGK